MIDQTSHDDREKREDIVAAFPPEIFDSIIDHLHDDKTSLAAISLVSRQCVAFAQSHLFHTIYILAAPTTATYCMPSLVDFLDKTRHACKYIQELHLQRADDSGTFQWRAINLDAHDYFLLTVQKLGAMHTLVLNHICLTAPTRSSLKARPPKKLRNLVLRSVVMEVDCFKSLLDIFSVRDSLQLPGTSVSGVEHMHSHCSAEKLWVKAGFYSLFKSFQLTTTFPNLTTLNVDFRGEGIAEDLLRSTSHFLHKNGRGLLHFRLNISDVRLASTRTRLDDSWVIFHLSASCPVLQSLHLGFASFPGPQPNIATELPAHLDFVVRVLSSAPGTLSRVVLSLFTDDDPFTSGDDSDQRVHWGPGGLTNILGSLHQLTSIKIVTQKASHRFSTVIDDISQPVNPSSQAYFTDQFSMLNERGILHFQ